MDPIKILQRAWRILWAYRALWVFGLILALATAGSSGRGGNNRVQYHQDGNNNPPTPQSMQQFFHDLSREIHKVFREGLPAEGISEKTVSTFIGILIAFIVVLLIVGIVVAIARYVSETAVIRMVDEYENTGTKLSVRQGFRIGWSRASWRLFLINLIVHLPLILLLLVLLGVGLTFYFTVVNQHQTLAIPSIAIMVGLVFLTIFVTIILSILLRLLREFFWRVAVLEGAGVRESLRRGFALVRENWKNVGLMWLVMIGLGIGWIIISIIAVIVTLPVVIVTAIIGAIAAAIPGLVLVGIFSTFLSGPLPWIAAALFILPLFFVIAFSPWLLLGSWKTVYTSTVWTLTYREIKTLPALTPPAEVQPASD